jgi:hypothetical protein
MAPRLLIFPQNMEHVGSFDAGLSNDPFASLAHLIQFLVSTENIDPSLLQAR